jgi:hypothetical protein
MITKWGVLQERANKLRAQLADIEEQLAWMERTVINTPCSGCETLLATEADFAKHFGLYGVATMNVGYCPTERARNEEAAARKS